MSNGRAVPGALGPRDLWRLMLDEAPAVEELISAEQLSIVFDAAWRVSMQPDEGRYPEVCVFVPLHAGMAVPTMRMGPIPFHRDALRAVATGVPPRPYALLVDRSGSGGTLAIRGVKRVEHGGLDRPRASLGLYVQILGPGRLIASLLFKDAQWSAELRYGEITRPIDISRSTVFQRVCLEAEQLMAGPRDGEDVVRAGARRIRSLLASVIATVQSLRHGGTLLVLPTRGSPASPAWLRVRFPLAVSESIAAEALSDREEAPSIGRAIAQLSVVDGAVVLGVSDVQGRPGLPLTVLGYGATIEFGDLPRCVLVDPNVTSAAARDPAEGVPWDLRLRGTRHQSAAWFCAEVPGAAAIVVSQDGDVSALEAVSAGTVLVQRPLSALLGSSSPIL